MSREPGDVLPDTIRLLITDALTSHAVTLVRDSRSRRYAGPHNAGVREAYRQMAQDCMAIADMARRCDPRELAHALGQAWDSGEPLRLTRREVIQLEQALGQLHKAAPAAVGKWQPLCATCGEPVKKVPGGNGPTWVHEATGAVAGYGPEREEET